MFHNLEINNWGILVSFLLLFLSFFLKIHFYYLSYKKKTINELIYLYILFPPIFRNLLYLPVLYFYGCSIVYLTLILMVIKGVSIIFDIMKVTAKDTEDWK